ncbi:MAG: hypothetical protein QOC87_2126 [Actinomycetota bacterium]|jgi:ubiquinone/menaquinone biosynthesis C-methylase UbiE|nr:hypothetical protein [Actinomycetota bacterium]
MSAPEDRRSVDRYFDEDVGYWSDIYEDHGLDAQIYRRRRNRVVRRIEELNLPAQTATLEVGCGAGSLAISLAKRGLDVTATDSSGQMLLQATEAAADHGAAITFLRADTQLLPFEDSSFDLVVAIGVIPWVALPEIAIREMGRVLRPSGHVVLTSDNLGRMNVVLDPRKTPAFGAFRKAIGRRLRAAGLARPAPEVSAAMFRRHRVIAWLLDAGLEISSSETIGFGPLTLFDRHVLSGTASIRLDEALQRLADRGTKPIAGAGAHQLVVARKGD